LPQAGEKEEKPEAPDDEESGPCATRKKWEVTYFRNATIPLGDPTKADASRGIVQTVESQT